MFGCPGHNFIGVHHWPKAIQLMGGPGYSFYFMLIQCPKIIQQPKVIQLMGGPGYSLYFMLIQCPKVIQQPKVIQLMGGPGCSLILCSFNVTS